MNNYNSKQRLFEVMVKVDKSFKPKLNESDNEHININELDTQTYAKTMNDTADYAWTTYLNKSYAGQERGRKEERVNNLARDRFLNAFNKEFPKGSIKINTTKGEYVYSGLKFEANYTSYMLFFQEANNQNFPKQVAFKKDNNKNGYYIDFNSDDLEITDQNSKNIINNMLKYNINAKQNNGIDL